jgi:3'(2'), 5'-bisphosphate nucleotidase
MPSSNASSAFAAELVTAKRLAVEAGAILRTFYEVPPVVNYKDSHEPVTEADRAANSYIVKQLLAAYPDDGILAEESTDDLTRLGKHRVWMVDPLDGTTEFIAHNGEFCSMIGLAVDGEPVVGAVYFPATGSLYSASLGGGAWVEEEGESVRLHVSRIANLRMLRPAGSRSHRTPLLEHVLCELGTQKEVLVGSIGLKVSKIAEGQLDFFVHPAAGPREWDTCAPQAILQEAGGTLTDCWNRKLTYNNRDVGLRFGILASNTASRAGLAGSIASILDDGGLDQEFGF